MLVTAAATLPLGWSIVIAVVPLVISLVALIGGWRQQSAARTQQATEHSANLEGQKEQLAATLDQQKAQLTATLEQQREQLDENLNHDREQQARTLEHERRQDDLREARGVLDDAAIALAEADDRRRDFLGDYGNRQKRQAVGAIGKRLDELQQRLAIRFGREHEVARSFARCSDALLRMFGATIFADDIDRESVDAAHRHFMRSRAEFTDAATAYAGVELVPRQP